MLKVARELWLCECYATGEMKILKGAVDDARSMVEKAGGFTVLRTQLREKNRARRKQLREERRTQQEQLDKHGHYRAWTIDDWYALS